MEILYKILEATVKAFDDENLIVEHFISTEHKDRGGDIMRVKGMKIVGKPVVLMLHGRGPMGSEPVGKPLSITVDEFKGVPGILAKTQFYNDEVGQRLYGKVKGGFLPNWSIGYSVQEAKDIVEAGQYAGREVTKWQLLEYSPVGVPMNPFAQTIKEFLDESETKGVHSQENGHWFGVVEEKSCTGCGACGKKHPCPTCKGELTLFVKDGNHIGTCCEKCEPEKFAELTKAITPVEDPPADPMKAVDEKIVVLEAKINGVVVSVETLTGSFKTIEEVFKKLEPLLKTLSPEPEGEDKGKESEGNPPEQDQPVPLVFQDEAAERRKEQADAIAAVQAILRPILQGQIDQVTGKVN